MPMKSGVELPIRLMLVAPPAGVAFGIQRGSGSGYETLFVQRSTRGDICFDFSLTIADERKGGRPDFRGPFVQGPPAARFIYVDVGTYAGQKDTKWSRRMKVPLRGITWPLIQRATKKPGYRVSANIPGTGRDGGPNCATVDLLGEWEVVAAQ
jgi:hypothetical protein